MNITICVGRLTKDPETKQAGKTTVTEVNIACSEKIGQRENQIFYKVNFWGEYGVALAKFFFKGNKIGVTGSLWREEFIDKKTGEKREIHKMTGQKWEFIEKNVKPEQAQAEPDSTEPNDDIPF